MAKRFGVSKSFCNPNIGDIDLISQSEEVPNNLREVLGGLQWAVTVARPDIARSVNVLSRFSANPCAKNRLEAGHRTIGFLRKNARDAGKVHAPSSEQKFFDNYRIDGEGRMFDPPPLNLFTDASLAPTVDNYYSVLGSLLTLYGAPIS